MFKTRRERPLPALGLMIILAKSIGITCLLCDGRPFAQVPIGNLKAGMIHLVWIKMPNAS
ncbi:MAG: hypothetical protein GX998_10175 [Firmicutes bacterium]|nr:hypothetical protein [Bacillota bacterium]